MGVRIHIDREFSGKLEDYCENAGGLEWICVFRHPSWYIYARDAVLTRKRNPWTLVRQCGSWANYVDNWEYYTGIYKAYAHRNYDGMDREKAPIKRARC